MNSSTIEELHEAIRRVRRRRNVIVHVRQIGWSLAILLALFILGVGLEMTLHPPSLFRILFFCLSAAAVGVLGWWYARAVRRFDSDDRRLAQYVDDDTPGLEQRLITSMDCLGKTGHGFSFPAGGIFMARYGRLRARTEYSAGDPLPTGLVCRRYGRCADLSSGRCILEFDPVFRGSPAGGLALVDPDCGFTAIGRLPGKPRGYSHPARKRRGRHRDDRKCLFEESISLSAGESLRMEACPDAGR